jgi:hypothetical protein
MILQQGPFNIAKNVAVKNPETDPVGVDLESTHSYRCGINLSVVCSYPSPETLSLELLGLATLFCVTITLKEMRRDLAWSCFDFRNCPC